VNEKFSTSLRPNAEITPYRPRPSFRSPEAIDPDVLRRNRPTASDLFYYQHLPADTRWDLHG